MASIQSLLLLWKLGMYLNPNVIPKITNIMQRKQIFLLPKLLVIIEGEKSPLRKVINRVKMELKKGVKLK